VTVSYTPLTREEVGRVHEASLRVLSRTGMRFGSDTLLRGLERAGARVDRGARIAKLPERLVEASLESLRKAIRDGRRLHLLNGVTSELTGGLAIDAKISGGCERFLDWDAQALREPTAEELLRCIRLGEMLPEVAFVGNPIVMRKGADGRPVAEGMRRIRTAALVAKNTRKVGSMEVWDEREIDFLVEIGTVARGSSEAFLEKPCLLTAKETISPLFLDEKAGDILLALARRGLPCTVIPMPITGLSAPATRLGSVIVGNAEILGAMTAIASVQPGALVGGGMISGLLDMGTGAVSFSAPEATFQDVALAEVHQRLYGMNFLIGSGYTDAKYPGSQVLAEKTMKFLIARLSGRTSHPVGLINGGSAFSGEQALVDLEICRAIHAHFDVFAGAEDLGELLALIDAVGPRGSFTESAHTLEHFRENWLPRIFDRTGFASLAESSAHDVYRSAHAEAERLLSAGTFWEIEQEKARAIDGIVAHAEKVLSA
jgi:trimethylamine--corrinoid protein Co-methyltransferase